MQNCRWGKETPQQGEQSPSEELTGSDGDAVALSRLGCGRHGGVGEVGGQPYGVFGTSTFSENHEDGGLSQRMRWVSNGLKLFLWPMWRTGWNAAPGSATSASHGTCWKGEF